MEEKKRLFFGLEIKAPWPESFPKGRVLEEQSRHLTLAFLGNQDFLHLQKELSSFPQPPFKMGFVGQFNTCLFLPPKHPHVAAWHIEWFENPSSLLHFHKELLKWLKEKGFQVDDKRPFLPHVTVSRAPFDLKAWKNQFSPLPMYTKDLHLFESLGNSQYSSLWNISLTPPFIEIEHTADMAFHIYGYSLEHIFYHAQTALAFHFPPLLPFLNSDMTCTSIEEIVIGLNQILLHADKEIGIPFKAVSFHGDLQKREDSLLSWEMIVDV